MRLNKLASLIGKTNVVADIGCDHGLLLKILFDEYDLKLGLAVDNKEEPLNNARANLRGYNTEFFKASSIKELITNFNFNKYDIDYIVLSGLGEKTILDILNDCFIAKNYLISSHTTYDEIIKLFIANKFYLEAHAIVKDNDKYYHLLKFSKDKPKKITKLEDDPEYLAYLDYEIKKLEHILAINKDSKKALEKKIKALLDKKIEKNRKL